jgi:hypothetical protein
VYAEYCIDVHQMEHHCYQQEPIAAELRHGKGVWEEQCALGTRFVDALQYSDGLQSHGGIPAKSSLVIGTEITPQLNTPCMDAVLTINSNTFRLHW